MRIHSPTASVDGSNRSPETAYTKPGSVDRRWFTFLVMDSRTTIEFTLEMCYLDEIHRIIFGAIGAIETSDPCVVVVAHATRVERCLVGFGYAAGFLHTYTAASCTRKHICRYRDSVHAYTKVWNSVYNCLIPTSLTGVSRCLRLNIRQDVQATRNHRNMRNK